MNLTIHYLNSQKSPKHKLRFGLENKRAAKAQKR